MKNKSLILNRHCEVRSNPFSTVTARYEAIYILLLCFLFSSCHGKPKDSEEEAQETTTPVTITHCEVGDMQEIVELNAVSTFLQKNQVSATTNGYVKSLSVLPGQRVAKGQVLFVLQGKEAANLGSTINNLDTTIHFSGEIKIIASSDGYMSVINRQAGDYVMEGEVLAEINQAGSLVFLMQLPFELSPYLTKNKTVGLELPDGKNITGTVSMTVPTVDPVSQTQSIVIRIPNNQSIPENLIAKVKIVKNIKKNTISLPKAAVLADETLENFWIMKMIDEEQAVKIPIKKGIESGGKVEILSPPLSVDDVILETGNYGLPDTAKVVINKPE